jgi:hypothetical protein
MSVVGTRNTTRQRRMISVVLAKGSRMLAGIPASRGSGATNARMFRERPRSATVRIPAVAIRI